MRCERSDCKNVAKLKISIDTGFVGCFCFKHSYSTVKRLMEDVHKSNRGLFVQKAPS